jgi:transposase
VKYYVGLDVSKHSVYVCVVDEAGKVVDEGPVASDAKSITAFLRGDRRRYALVGLEAGAMATHLCRALMKAGLPALCIEAAHAHRVLAARRNKTDRNDARGIADVLRTGQYRPVHVKSPEIERLRALLTARKLLSRKVADLSRAIRGILLSCGGKMARGGRSTFEARARVLADKSALRDVIDPLLKAYCALECQLLAMERLMRRRADEDPVCRLLMTAPGIGFRTATLFRTVIDEPARFARSRDVGAYLGLVPRIKQSGLVTIRGGITKGGDREMREALFLAAQAVLRANARPSWLKTWGRRIAIERGWNKGSIAVARKLAVTLHRMWSDDAPFDWTYNTTAVGAAVSGSGVD